MGVFSIAGNIKYGKDILKSCEYSVGGGMLGGSERLELRRDGDRAVLIHRKRETHADREVICKYKLSAEPLDRAAQIALKYDLYEASKRPRSRVQILDGDTSHIEFTFSKGDFSISDQLILSVRMRKGFNEFRDYLYSLASGECEESLEPQNARLHLKSGYNLMFEIDPLFDGKFDDILSEEYEVKSYEDCGIILHDSVKITDITKPAEDDGVYTCKAPRGKIIYHPEKEYVILMYEDHVFDHPIYIAASLNHDPSSACPLIKEMTGPYSMNIN